MSSVVVRECGRECRRSLNDQKTRISPLRMRMIQDMHLAGLSEGTHEAYISAVAAIQKHFRTRPDRLTEEQVYRYVIWLREEKGIARGTFQTHFHGLKFFYYRMLGVDWTLFTKKKSSNPARNAYRKPYPGKNAAA